MISIKRFFNRKDIETNTKIDTNSDEIRFYSVKDKYGFLSNFSFSKINVGIFFYPTVEHFFQCAKFDDIDIKEKIRSLSSPLAAAKEGRKREYPIRKNWDDIRDSIMLKGLRAKFFQHPKLLKELIQTGDKILIEHTSNDNYWGNGGDDSGQNMLGKMLMQIRDEIKNFSNDENLILPPWIAFPDLDKYDMFWRMGWGEEYLINLFAYISSFENPSEYKTKFPPPEEWNDWYD